MGIEVALSAELILKLFVDFISCRVSKLSVIQTIINRLIINYYLNHRQDTRYLFCINVHGPNLPIRTTYKHIHIYIDTCISTQYAYTFKLLLWTSVAFTDIITYPY